MQRWERSESVARWVGLAVGLAIALSAIVAWRIPGGTGVLGADITLAVNPTGELGVSPTGSFLQASHLQPGLPPKQGTFDIRNQTGRTLSVRVRVTPSDPGLDDVAWVEVAVDGGSIYRGTLGGLRSWSASVVTLPSGDQQTVSFQTWLPASVDRGYQGAIEVVTVELQSLAKGG
jgi:hypothetical protein